MQLRPILLMFAIAYASGGQAQDAQSLEDQSVFTAENAIVDTSIPFAIGAREARQELRSAFGWPTFQEGLVEGVYFRFDPDGYARFAPTPRLDTDVFEVICRPGTLNCLGRKGAMSVYLNGQGAVQLQLDDVGDGDTLAIVDGITELPLPPTILKPLDARLETLLGTGGELVIRRGQQQVARLSLSGFSAVVPYLRWITARQDYSVLPRDWPVPNSVVPEGDPIAVNWQSASRRQEAEATIGARAQAALDETAVDVAEVRGELNVLRDLLIARNQGSETDAKASERAVELQAETTDVLSTNGNGTTTEDARVELLEARAEELMQEIIRLRSREGPQMSVTEPEKETHDEMASLEVLASPAQPRSSMSTVPSQFAIHLEYLISEIGLDPETALMVVQANDQPVRSTLAAREDADVLMQSPQGDAVVLDILQELRAQLPEEMSNQITTVVSQDQRNSEESNRDFILLTEYFLSVFEKASR